MAGVRYEVYKPSALGESLTRALDAASARGELPREAAAAITAAFERRVAQRLREHAGGEPGKPERAPVSINATMTGFNNLDRAWVMTGRDVLISTPEGDIKADRLRIVAVDRDAYEAAERAGGGPAQGPSGSAR